MKYEITEHVHSQSGEKYFSFHHKSGVSVYIAPNGYTTACAIYTADFGGADTKFSVDGAVHETPAGIAHFLEHKLFETEDGGDAFRLFSQLGADSNAFTSHTATSFTFSCPVDVFCDSLSVLLHFVHTPHFTASSVEKERGIIEEELNMYEDNPDSRIYYELMKCLYKNDGIRYDVGGTTDSIKKITADMLYFCHSAFYSPQNMSLVISGGIDPEKVAAVMDGQIPEPAPRRVAKIRPPEPVKAYRKLSRINMDVAEPLFSFGIKDLPPGSQTDMRRRSAALSILCSMLFGASSEFYCDCYEKGLISGDTDAGYYYTENNAYLSITGESKRPFAVKRRIIETIEKALSDGIDDVEFERMKKVFYASFIYSMQSSSSVAYSLLSFCQLKDDMLKYPDLISGTDSLTALRCLRELYDKDRCAFAVVEPFKEDKNVSRNIQRV